LKQHQADDAESQVDDVLGGKKRKTGRTIVAFLVAATSAVIAFFVTCSTATEGAMRIAAPDAIGEAYTANSILYGLLVGFPLGLVVAWLVAVNVEKLFCKSEDKK